MDYVRLSQSAERLLRRAGRACTLTKRAKGTYDASSSRAAQGAPEHFPITCVTLEFNAREVDGTMILAGDLRAYTISKEAVPAVGDMVTIDGKQWRIEDPRPLNPGGVTLLYDLQLRKP